MPTVLAIFGLRVTIYPNDHRPAHVHVIGQGCEAMFSLHCPDGPSELRENYGFSHKELNKIASGLNAGLTALCDKWSQIHGYY
ncbi:DUF4160 domain-containing protein [Collimonas antrihumi]|uniref:DUF4160 domain-containing protein n=1 Tax=Collimonas antrihumi TaxID=1940615 RepID=UPI001B8BB06B